MLQQILFGLSLLISNTESGLFGHGIFLKESTAGETATLELAESVTPGKFTGIYISAKSDLPNSKISYTLLSQSSYGRIINSNSTGAMMFLKGVLDFENTPSYLVTIRALDTSSTDIAVVKVSLSNSPPVFSSEIYRHEICDSSEAGTAVTTMKATDPENSKVTYSLQKGGDIHNDFGIDKNEGVITVTSGKLAIQDYVLVVLATDRAFPEPGIGIAIVTVSVVACES